MDEETRRAVATADEALPTSDALPDAVEPGGSSSVSTATSTASERSSLTASTPRATSASLHWRVRRPYRPLRCRRRSLSFEWLQQGSRTGGHTSHLARAFGGWSFDPAMVGMYGDPVHDAFETEFGEYELHSLGEPGVTDAVEFDDGKLMLTEIGDTMSLTGPNSTRPSATTDWPSNSTARACRTGYRSRRRPADGLRRPPYPGAGIDDPPETVRSTPVTYENSTPTGCAPVGRPSAGWTK